MRDVILHAFNWRYRTIEEKAEEIAKCGYGAVLFPPPLYSEESGAMWWQRYQPKDYRVVRSHLGKKEDLKKAIDALSAHGVRAYTDLVFNHMANDKQYRIDRGEENFYQFPGDFELRNYRENPEAFERDRLYGDLSVGLFSPWDFNAEGDIKQWNNPDEVEEKWLSGLPDLDMNDWVVSQQILCIEALCDLGFSGFRIDALKHLPVQHLMRVFTIDALKKKFIFGESLTTDDNEEAAFLWPIIQHTEFPCYDFALHETMRRAFGPSGSLRELTNPSALGQALPWHRALTFTVTHDIPNNDPFRGMLFHPQDEYLANAYVLGRDGGVPMVYSDHNESADKHECDKDRWAECWKRGDIVGMIRFHNALHGEAARPLYEADGFLVLARNDRGILAVNKTADWQHPTIETSGLRSGVYRCQLHGYEMRVGTNPFTFDIPPREAQLWLFEENASAKPSA